MPTQNAGIVSAGLFLFQRPGIAKVLLGFGEPFFPWYHYGGNYLNVVNITNIRNVTNITNITSVTNINNIHYQYQNIATTAVPKNAFSSGQPVARQMVHLTPQQLAKAQVIPHPAVNPSPSSNSLRRLRKAVA